MTDPMRFLKKVLILFLLTGRMTAAEIDLSGEWRWLPDFEGKEVPEALGAARFTESVHLPGTASESGKGVPLSLETSVDDKASMSHLYPRFEYKGVAWYRREIDIPADWSGHDVELVMERVMWESKAWVNGRPAGARDSLSAPHRYEIGELLTPGNVTRC